MSHSRFQTARKLLIFWTFFIGLGAVAGAAAMLIDPSGRALGMDAMLPYFQVLPFAGVLFQNFIFSGWALLIVNGLSNLTAACLLLAKKKAGVVLGGTAIVGGKGTLTGCVLGTLLIVLVENSMILIGVPVVWKDVFVGLLIVIGTAVSAYQATHSGTKRRTRTQAKEAQHNG